MYNAKKVSGCLVSLRNDLAKPLRAAASREKLDLVMSLEIRRSRAVLACEGTWAASGRCNFPTQLIARKIARNTVATGSPGQDPASIGE